MEEIWMGNQKVLDLLTLKWSLDCKVEMSSNPLVMSLEFKRGLKAGDFHLNHQILLCHLESLNRMRSLHSVILNPPTHSIHWGRVKVKYWRPLPSSDQLNPNLCRGARIMVNFKISSKVQPGLRTTDLLEWCGERSEYTALEHVKI